MIEYNNKVPYLIPINRTGRFSLDCTEIFYSIEELDLYVNDDARCYPGQVVSVCTEESGNYKSDVYVIVGPIGEEGEEPEGPFTYQKINTSESVLDVDVTVRTDHVGAVKKGFKFESGTSFTKFARIICGDYGYTKPTASVEYGDKETNGYFPYYEVGYPLNCVTIGKFVQNDAGALTQYTLLFNGTVIYNVKNTNTGGLLTSTDMTWTVDGNSYDGSTYDNIIKDGTDIVLKSRFTYGEGEIKEGLEELEGTPEGHIKAGSIECTQTLKSFRYSYCGTSINSSIIFNGGNKTSINNAVIKDGKAMADVGAGDTFAINVNQGDTIVWFAYPSRLGVPKKITSDAQFGAKIDNFDDNVVTSMIGSYNDFNPINYTIMYYIPAVPYTGKDTIRVSF